MSKTVHFRHKLSYYRTVIGNQAASYRMMQLLMPLSDPDFKRRAGLSAIAGLSSHSVSGGAVRFWFLAGVYLGGLAPAPWPLEVKNIPLLREKKLGKFEHF